MIQQNLRLPLMALASFALLSACGNNASDNTAKSVADKAVKEVSSAAKKVAPKKAKWSYSGETGPEHWGELSEAFATCSTGKLQSPFDISADITAVLPELGLNYNSVPMKVLNNGYTIQADTAGGGQLVVDGKTYDLLQFHFHAGSEYTIDGATYPMDLHLVHASKEGELAVVGVVIKEGEANPELAKLWANMPASKGENVVEGQSVDVNNLLPASKQYYRFMGSLTTPPCSEGVNWHVLSEPITASAEQIAAYRAIHPMNARPLQPENNRLVVLGK